MSSDGELEQEVDENRIVTDQDRGQAAELKQKANKAFASEYTSYHGQEAMDVPLLDGWKEGRKEGRRKVVPTFLSSSISPGVWRPGSTPLYILSPVVFSLLFRHRLRSPRITRFPAPSYCPMATGLTEIDGYWMLQRD